MTLKNVPNIIIGNHLITNICIDNYNDLEDVIKDKGCVALRNFGNNVYGASIVMNWQYGIIQRYINNKSLYLAININKLERQNKVTRKYKRTSKKVIIQPIPLLRFNPLHDEHIDQYIKDIKININLK